MFYSGNVARIKRVEYGALRFQQVGVIVLQGPRARHDRGQARPLRYESLHIQVMTNSPRRTSSCSVPSMEMLDARNKALTEPLSAAMY
jgi:hypothetical protein